MDVDWGKASHVWARGNSQTSMNAVSLSSSRQDYLLTYLCPSLPSHSVLGCSCHSGPVGPLLFQLCFSVSPPTVARPASLSLSLRIPGQGLACGAGCWLPEGVSNPAPLPPTSKAGKKQGKISRRMQLVLQDIAARKLWRTLPFTARWKKEMKKNTKAHGSQQHGGQHRRCNKRSRHSSTPV